MDNSTVTEIFQRDLLCSGNEDNLLDCQHHRGSRDCPSDHSEDAGVKCNGKVPLTYVCTFWNLVIMGVPSVFYSITGPNHLAKLLVPIFLYCSCHDWTKYMSV